MKGGTDEGLMNGWREVRRPQNISEEWMEVVRRGGGRDGEVKKERRKHGVEDEGGGEKVYVGGIDKGGKRCGARK